ncbi:MAG: AAA family ATPase [Planctomycetes bacterium]|nr:AAA family ATPase [Planctomycetota bacterium]
MIEKIAMIKQVHLTNFRCFTDQRVSLDPFTVLIGKNDTGKSSFLDSLRLLTLSARRNAPNARPEWDESLRAGSARNSGRIALGFDGDLWLTSTPDRPLPDAVQKTTSPFMLRFVNQMRGPYRLNVKLMRAPSEVGGQDYAEQPLAEDGMGLASVIERLPFSRQKRLQEAFLPKVPAVLEVRADPVREKRGYKELRFEVAGGGIVRAERISDGVLLLLAFVTIAVDEYHPAVLMVEEPENGIHPKQLREVLSLLYSLTVRTNDPIQVILTTHSPYVLDFVPPTAVRVFRRDEKSGSVDVLPFAEVAPIKEMLAGGYTPGEAWFNSDEDHLTAPKKT